MPTFGRSLQPQDSAYILTPLLPSSAFGGSLGKSSSDTHHSGDASEGASGGTLLRSVVLACMCQQYPHV